MKKMIVILIIGLLTSGSVLAGFPVPEPSESVDAARYGSSLQGVNTTNSIPEKDSVLWMGQSNAGSYQVSRYTEWYDEPDAWSGYTNAYVYVPWYLFGPYTSNAYNNIFMNPSVSTYNRFQSLRGWGAYVPAANIMCEEDLRESYHVVVSDGGTSLADWLPVTGLYTNVAPSLANAKVEWSGCPDFNAFVLFAHENDASTNASEVTTYSNNLTTIISQLWTDYGTNPVVLVGYGDRYVPPQSASPGADLFTTGTDNMLRNYAEADVNIGYVSARKLPYDQEQANVIHYTVEGMAQLGGRVATKIRALQATHVTDKNIGAEEVYGQRGYFGELDVGADLRLNGVKLESLIKDIAEGPPISTDGLVYYFPLDGESYTNVTDSVEYVSDGLGGIVAKCEDGSTGAWPDSGIKGLQITNTYDFSQSSWSISMWVRIPDTFSSTPFFFGMGNGDYSTNTCVGVNSSGGAGGVVYYRFHTNAVSRKDLSYPITDSDFRDDWMHVGIGYNKDNGQYLFNFNAQELTYNAEYAYPDFTRPDINNPWTLGFVHNIFDIGVVVYLDDFIAFNRLLTPHEFANIYRRGRGKFYREPLRRARSKIPMSAKEDVWLRYDESNDTLYLENGTTNVVLGTIP